MCFTIKSNKLEAEQMAQSRKYSPRKNEDLSLDSLHLYENWVLGHIPVIPALKGQTQQDPEVCWPASLAESMSSGSKTKMESDIEDTRHRVLSCACAHMLYVPTDTHTYT